MIVSSFVLFAVCSIQRTFAQDIIGSTPPPPPPVCSNALSTTAISCPYREVYSYFPNMGTVLAGSGINFSLNSCQAKCSTTADCVAFVFKPTASNNCYLISRSFQTSAQPWLPVQIGATCSKEGECRIGVSGTYFAPVDFLLYPATL
jgi:hypothetical protein